MPIPSKASVGVQPQGWLVHDLLDPHVGRPGDLRDAGRHLGGKGIILVEVAPGDLDVDGRRQPEIQYLRRDVVRQEAELRAREVLPQSGPECPLIEGGRRGLTVQCQRDVAILRADRAAVAVGLIDAGRGQAAVQQAADDVAWQQFVYLLIHEHRQLRGLLDAGAGGGGHVQLHRP
jgi:hypothetical protein